jgi:hypothetical protein
MAPLLNQGYCLVMSIDLQGQICSMNCAANRLMLWEPCIKTGKVSLFQATSAKLKKEHVSAYKHRLMIMNWRIKKYICLINTTHDEMILTTV